MNSSSFIFRKPKPGWWIALTLKFLVRPHACASWIFLIAPHFSRIGAERPSVTLQVVKKTQRLKTFTNTIAGVRQRERENASDNFSCCNGLFRSRRRERFHSLLHPFTAFFDGNEFCSFLRIKLAFLAICNDGVLVTSLLLFIAVVSLQLILIFN